jgi:(2Fe-2S) ferredoxin
MSYYRRHVFFCLNERQAPEACCACHGAAEMQAYAKQRVKELGLSGKGQVRINKSGCLDRCEEGPCLVVYPEGVWYTYVDKSDIDEIVQSHIVEGRIVERLRI